MTKEGIIAYIEKRLELNKKHYEDDIWFANELISKKLYEETQIYVSDAQLRIGVIRELEEMLDTIKGVE